MVGPVATKVQPHRRRRSLGLQGRPQALPDLSHELFQWWVDMSVTLQARVSSESTMRQAEIIRGDAERFIAECDENGVALPPAARTLPKLSWVWLHRWRKEWGLTPQTVNAKYKVSFEKVVMRLGVLWRNATRLLVLHETLFGPGKLTFASIDEKPFWFNALGGNKVWAQRGARKRAVKEKRTAMLERWTGMTICYSRGCQPGGCPPEACPQGGCRPGGVPKWAALFKAVHGARIHVDVPDGVKVQFAPNGSYKTEQVIEYLGWVLPNVTDPAVATVVPVLDWYSAHICDEVAELVALKTQSPVLYIGGGTTGLVAVCDVPVPLCVVPSCDPGRVVLDMCST